MLTLNEEKRLTRLKEDLTMPKWKYLLVYGLSFGIAIAIISPLIDVLIGWVPLSDIFKRRFWINLAMAPLTGYLFASIYRWLSVKQYIKLKEKNHSPD